MQPDQFADIVATAIKSVVAPLQARVAALEARRDPALEMPALAKDAAAAMLTQFTTALMMRAQETAQTLATSSAALPAPTPTTVRKHIHYQRIDGLLRPMLVREDTT